MNRKIKDSKVLLVYERELWGRGFAKIAGIDEVGRGPLAGPVVAAAAIFDKDSPVPPVNDSKKLSEKQRNELREILLQLPGFRYAIAEIQPEEIDSINILKATHKAMRKALEQVPEADFVLIDGLPVPGIPKPNRSIVKGDSKSASIAAASIMAKVYRDELMMQFAVKFPEYGFDKNKGYGTKAHLEAIKKFGACPIHRKTFSPIREILGLEEEQIEFEL